MFSQQQKHTIAHAIEAILLGMRHPEMPTEKPNFALHVDGKESWSWADIKPNWMFDPAPSNLPPQDEAQASARRSIEPISLFVNEKEYKGIRRFGLHELGSITLNVTREPMPTNPFLMAMVQNEDMIDFWILDPADRALSMESLRQYYRDEEPWVINHARFAMRVFSLSPEIVY